MNVIDRFLLKRILKKNIYQGPETEYNITDIYKEINTIVKDVFYEDNEINIKCYLLECFRKSFD